MALAVDALNELLMAAVAGRAAVRVQNPVEIGRGTEPNPDIAVVRRPWDGYPRAHPRPEDVFLLVEVADTSLATDRGAKLELYARAGIREFWIVDVTTWRAGISQSFGRHLCVDGQDGSFKPTGD